MNSDGHIIAVSKNNSIFKLEGSDTAQDLRKSDNAELAGFVTKALEGNTGLET